MTISRPIYFSKIINFQRGGPISNYLESALDIIILKDLPGQAFFKGSGLDLSCLKFQDELYEKGFALKFQDELYEEG